MIRVDGAIVDSHVHVWDRDLFSYPWLESAGPPLGSNFLPADYAELTAAGPRVVDGMVFVQADCAAGNELAEARWVQTLADAGSPFIAIVAAAPLERGDACVDLLKSLAELPLVTGVRRLLQDEPEGFALAPDFVGGVRALADLELSMDLCVRQWQIPEASELVSRVPEVEFVLDHFGKPAIERAEFPAWAEALSGLARNRNVKLKMSGLLTEAAEGQRSYDQLRPWIDHALSEFGPERCMFGSDWPVVTLGGGFVDWLGVVESALDGYSAREQVAVFGANARAHYSPACAPAQSKEA